jgi:hypothetical protein
MVIIAHRNFRYELLHDNSEIYCVWKIYWGILVYFVAWYVQFIHKRSDDNGMRLINFASSRNMVAGSTMFEHKDIHTRTRKSPDGNVFNEIDHILINVRLCSDMRD